MRFVVAIGIAVITLGVIWFTGETPQTLSALSRTCSNDLPCLMERLETVAKEEDLSRAITLSRELDERDLEFHRQCHLFMHEIGGISYARIKTGEPVNPGDDAVLCKNGFYHGLILAFEADRGTLAGTEDFCRGMMGTTLDPGRNYERVLGDCFHGIGNAAVQMYLDTTMPPSALVQEAVARCRAVTTDAHTEEECVGGIFGYLTTLWSSEGYDLGEDVEQEPFALCEIESEYRTLCMGYFSRIIFVLAGKDPDAALVRLFELDGLNPEDMRVVITAFMAIHGSRIDRNEMTAVDPGRAVCTDLGAFEEPCIEGFVSGLISQKAVGDAFAYVRTLCSSLPQDRAHSCVARASADIERWLPPHDKDVFCRYAARDGTPCPATTS